MVIHKPYSRKLAAKYIARAIQRIREDLVDRDGQEAVVEPLLERLMRELEPELVDLGVKVGTQARQQGAIRYGVRTQLDADAFSVGHGSVRCRENRGGEYYTNAEQVQTDNRGWLELTDALALQYLRLMRDSKVQETLYALLTSQHEQAKIQEARDTPTVQVLDTGIPAEKKSKPIISLNILIAGVLALFVGIFLAFFLEYLERIKAQDKLRVPSAVA
jgi:hypothetical protein